jgi:phenylalanyl-tRNA synthetase beta chain
MANIKIPIKEFETQAGILTEQMKNKLQLFGTPLESISDTEIELEIFPDRPDLLSAHGFLRSFKAFLGKEPEKCKLKKPEKNYKVIITPEVGEVRPSTACAIVKNLKFNDDKIKEIIDLQEKLHSTLGRNRKKVAIGIYPLEKIKLPITYTAKKPNEIKFIPLESQREMTGSQILQKTTTGRNYAHLLEKEKLYPIFVDAQGRVLSMPPIINSHETGKVSEQTKEVFIECSGSDFSILKKTLNIIITTLADQGGHVYQMDLSYGSKKSLTPDLTPEKMKINIENINKLLGLSLTESQLTKLLPKMNLNYKNKTVEIPAWRTDILHEVDIAEDIAIAFGYQNLKPEIPTISTIASEDTKEKFKNKIAEILLGFQLTEISTYHLIKKQEADSLKLQDKIELQDSKTEYKILRPNLLIPSLRILSENKDHDYPQKLFEIGTVFSHDSSGSSETSIKEQDNLIIASAPANFTDLKQILDSLFSTLNTPYKLEETIRNGLIEGRTAEIISNNKQIGYLGEIHPQTLKDFGIKMPLAVLEINLDEIFKLLE